MRLAQNISRIEWGATVFEISGCDNAIFGIYTANRDSEPEFSESEATRLAARQLDEYFRKGRRSFDLPLAEEGTEFQMQVWRALRQIPWGDTITYSELAALTGRSGAARAVGGAAGKNRLLIVTPCHRLVAAGRMLGGFSAGLPLKEKLLRLEGVRLP